MQRYHEEQSARSKGGRLSPLDEWGGKTYRAILEGETYYRVPPLKPVLEASESGIGLVCARFL